MEDMDIQQTPFPDQEHENSKRGHVEDDNSSYPSKRREKFSSFPCEKPALPILGWSKIVNFRLYTVLDVKVYKDIIGECKKEIKACEFAFESAEKFFNTNFGVLKEKHPNDYQSSDVIRYFNHVKDSALRCLESANKIFPDFEDYVNNYIKFREGPLEDLQVAEDRYRKNIIELAKKPNAVKILIMLNNDEDKKGNLTKINPREIRDISFHLWMNTGINYGREDTLNKEREQEQDDKSCEDLSLQYDYKILKKDLITVRREYECAEGIVEENIKKYVDVYSAVYQMVDLLKSADITVRTMRRQLEILVEKVVIENGYDDDFDDEWLEASRPVPIEF